MRSPPVQLLQLREVDQAEIDERRQLVVTVGPDHVGLCADGTVEQLVDGVREAAEVGTLRVTPDLLGEVPVQPDAPELAVGGRVRHDRLEERPAAVGQGQELALVRRIDQQGLDGEVSELDVPEPIGGGERLDIDVAAFAQVGALLDRLVQRNLSS